MDVMVCGFDRDEFERKLRNFGGGSNLRMFCAIRCSFEQLHSETRISYHCSLFFSLIFHPRPTKTRRGRKRERERGGLSMIVRDTSGKC